MGKKRSTVSRKLRRQRFQWAQTRSVPAFRGLSRRSADGNEVFRAPLLSPRDSSSAALIPFGFGSIEASRSRNLVGRSQTGVLTPASSSGRNAFHSNVKAPVRVHSRCSKWNGAYKQPVDFARAAGIAARECAYRCIAFFRPRDASLVTSIGRLSPISFRLGLFTPILVFIHQTFTAS